MCIFIGSVPKVGIEMYDMPTQIIGDNTAARNYFNKLNTGIVAQRSTVRIYNSRFENIQIDTLYQEGYRGSAIVSKGRYADPCYANSDLTVYPNVHDTTVYNCHRGIYTSYSNLLVDSNKILRVSAGIYSTNSNGLHAMATHNLITASFRGVVWSFNAGASYMCLKNNTILISGSDSAKAVVLREKSNTPPNDTISENIITITNAQDGIFAQGVYNPVINANIITQTGGSVPPSKKTYGIRVNGCTYAMVGCNDVTSNYSNTTTGSFGIHVNASKYFVIACNKTTNHYQGIYFNGDCTGSDENFKGNTMKDNYSGLYLTTTAKIGTQSWKGNLWINYIGPDGAENYNILGLGASLFYVNNNTTELPITPGNNAGWFNPLAGNIFGCADTCVHSVVATDALDTTYSRHVADNDTTTADYIEESNSIARQYLFEKLNDDSTLLYSDTLFIHFYNNHVDSAVGKLYDARTKITHSYSIDPYSASLMAATDSLISIKQDSIVTVDSLALLGLLSNADVIRQSLIDAINLLQQVMSNLVTQSQINASLIRGDAELVNTSVVADELPEQNEQFANSMILLFDEYGADTLLFYWNDMMNVAVQCPSQGGSAVYIIRNFIAMFNDSIDYEDEYACLQVGMYKQAAVI